MPESDLNLLVALDALLAEGSVAGAARRLGLSASAMSRTLARLRAATGDPLLVRAGRAMVPTPHAQAIRERTRGALHDAQAVLRPAGADLDLAGLQRTLTIRANDGFVEAFGAQLIAAIAADAPQVMLRFAAKPEKSSAPLREGTADLEIGVLGEMGPEVRVQALFRDRFVGVVRRGHPLCGEIAAGHLDAARYAAFGHVVASRKRDPRGPVDDALTALGLARTIAAAVPSFPAALAVARHSDLIALVPASFIGAQGHDAPDGRDAAFLAFALPVTTGIITVSQMWHPRLDADPVHRWLRQHVLDACRGRITRESSGCSSA